MKLIRLFLAIALAFTFLATVADIPASAAAKETKPPPPTDTRILIKAVDLKAGTVTLKYMRSDKAPDHTYTVDLGTQLKVNNVDGKITDIKVGMVVDSYLERDNDTLDGLTLSGYGGSIAPIGAKPGTPPKPKPAAPATPSDSSQ